MATPEQYGTYSNNYGFSFTVNGPPNKNGAYTGTRDRRPSTNEYYPEDFAKLIEKGWRFEPLYPKPTPATPTEVPAVQAPAEMGSMGGRRRGTKKARKGNKMLSSWVAFVKKVQHEEKISYSDAMKRASARKKEWKMGQMGGQGVADNAASVGGGEMADKTSMTMSAGRRRRRGSRRRGSRRSRR